MVFTQRIPTYVMELEVECIESDRSRYWWQASKVVIECLNVLNNLGRIVALMWLAGHTGIDNIEKVDELNR